MPKHFHNSGTVADRKESLRSFIAGQLKPNSYMDEHSWWGVLDKALQKLTLQELNVLSTLITCKRRQDVSK